ncbi:MAG: 50S ribosomal protein L4 [Candidatus Portnoybacteria bacterium CG10_big_fil_rev_8_21_14_0_10_38_18]|uniref:Large ribosomal subunit protein uL4 n=1 Tax=Candidatus Portnoybacteria bacterium CG10_big_fil_rev_8_21_14_0_10_38_18 TaxID=1974813 RepID=A0A2M8KCF8_9BACT|nr:MAG: 50S ribosomal protein L4 [Candidatus Portnoybacteria bacterium CG10_big_fil_rev_8_21_14_0_10_38_18]
MLSLPVYNLEGEQTGTVKLPEKIFGIEINNDLLYSAINIQTANRRKHLAKTKDRSEVRGGGVKPWRQKGTGRARHGSIRSPLWKGGGVTFGPIQEKKFEKKINKKVRKKALLMALSSKLRDKELILLDVFKLDEGKTKLMVNIIDIIFEKAAGITSKKKPSVLMAIGKRDNNLIKASRNIPYVKAVSVDSLNVFDLLSFKYLFLDKEGIKIIEKTHGTV